MQLFILINSEYKSVAPFHEFCPHFT